MKEVPNITYLLGAGASANCLPVIDELPIKLTNFRDNLQNRIRIAAQPANQNGSVTVLPNPAKFDNESKEEDAKILIGEIEWLIKELENHNTVDTLAKKFYLIKKNHTDLLRLKRLLVTYFIYEQSFKYGKVRGGTFKELPDKRYDNLIATIIDRRIDNLSLPPNIKIITWNYDMQFELAYKEYQPNSTISGIQKRIQAIPNEAYNDGKDVDLSKFCLVRLNGVAQLSTAVPNIGKLTGIASHDDRKFTNLLSKIVSFYENLRPDELDTFTYSWENPDEFDKVFKQKKSVIDVAKQIMSNTNVLVIIGYSFPLFNRSIDRELISCMPRSGYRVYVQDTKERANELRDLLINSFDIFANNESWTDRHIKAIESTNQFFIPPQANI